MLGCGRMSQLTFGCSCDSLANCWPSAVGAAASFLPAVGFGAMSRQNNFADIEALLGAEAEGEVDFIAERYSIPAITVSALKRAGNIAAFRLLGIIEDDRFSDLPVKTQLEVIETALDRAFGKSENATAHVTARSKIPNGGDGKLALGKQLEQIEGWTPPELRGRDRERGGGGRTALPPVGGGANEGSPASRRRPDNVVQLSRSDIPSYSPKNDNDGAA